MTQKTIGVFGSYATQPGDALYRLAYDLGAALASAGFAVLNGGYDGIMRASSEGAKHAGGRTIGVICPTVLRKRGAELRHNEFLDEVHKAPTMLTRIEAMMRGCGGYVFLEGGTGTLSELGVIWEYVNKGFIRRRPLVLLGEFWHDVADRIAAARPGADQHLNRAKSPAEVVAILNEHAVGARTQMYLSRLSEQVGAMPIFDDHMD